MSESKRSEVLHDHSHAGWEDWRNLRRMLEKHKSYNNSDMQSSYASPIKRKLVRRLIEISDNHGGLL